MHMVEACLALFEATLEPLYLERAYGVAKRLCVDLSFRTPGGLVFEHYTEAGLHCYSLSHSLYLLRRALCF